MVKRRRVVLKNCPEREDSEENGSVVCENISPVNDIMLQNSQTESSTAQSTEMDKLKNLKVKVKRLRNPQSDNHDDANKKKPEKGRQPRSKEVSQELPQRRSPRNTAEAREARAKSGSLRLKELHYGGEDICGRLSKEKQELAALYLSEINRKLCSVVWKQ